MALAEKAGLARRPQTLLLLTVLALAGCGRPHEPPVPPCSGVCWQAAVTASYAAINTLDCDYGHDYFGGENCVDDFNDVNRAPRFDHVYRLPSGRWLVRVTVFETTGINDTFDVTVSADGRRPVYIRAQKKRN